MSASDFGYQVESVELTVYRDGLVHGSHVLSANETFPSISLALLSSLVANVVVVDENQTVLDYDIEGTNMTIFSLGASRVLLEYDTIALTEKESGVWTLLVQNPYELTLYLPEDSTIVYLNQMPASIDTEEGRITLSLYPAEWEISYVLPIIGPALFRVSDLTVNPAEVEVGNEVTISVVLANIGEEEGSYTLALEINDVIDGSKTVTLDAGASTTVHFEVTKGEAGTYEVEIGELRTTFNVRGTPPIPEKRALTRGLERGYGEMIPPLTRFSERRGKDLYLNLGFPRSLRSQNMHLDPDFDYLTYGDVGTGRGSELTNMNEWDIIAFYGSLRPIYPSPTRLVYALLGLYIIDEVVWAIEIPESRWKENAHTRRQQIRDVDVVVRAKPRVSGRLKQCIPIGEWRNRSYRVRSDLLDAWGGLSVKDGFIQRSVVPPSFLEPEKFYDWFNRQNVSLFQRNNLD